MLGETNALRVIRLHVISLHHHNDRRVRFIPLLYWVYSERLSCLYSYVASQCRAVMQTKVYSTPKSGRAFSYTRLPPRASFQVLVTDEKDYFLFLNYQSVLYLKHSIPFISLIDGISNTFTSFLKMKTLYIFSSFRFIAKLRGRYRDFPYTSALTHAVFPDYQHPLLFTLKLRLIRYNNLYTKKSKNSLFLGMQFDEF